MQIYKYMKKPSRYNIAVWVIMIGLVIIAVLGNLKHLEHHKKMLLLRDAGSRTNFEELQWKLGKLIGFSLDHLSRANMDAERDFHLGSLITAGFLSRCEVFMTNLPSGFKAQHRLDLKEFEYVTSGRRFQIRHGRVGIVVAIIAPSSNRIDTIRSTL